MNSASLAVEMAIDALSLGPHAICFAIFTFGFSPVRFVIKAAFDLIALAIQVSIYAFALRRVIVVIRESLSALGHCR
jgi:hypothetical protein